MLNRAKEPRQVTIEHQTPADWKLVGDAKPVEGSQGLYRFPLDVKADAAASQDVTENRTATVAERVATLTEDKIQFYLTHSRCRPT